MAVLSPSTTYKVLDYGPDKEASVVANNSQKNVPITSVLPLRSISVVISETLFLNNYEVDIVLRSYLKIWIKEVSYNYVPCSKLLYEFPTKFYGIIRSFFADKPVYYDGYLTFVMLFTFFTPEQLLPLMFSMCQINSNMYITKNQIIKFLNTYSINQECFRDMFDSLSKKREQVYLQQHFMSATMFDHSFNPSTDPSAKLNSYQIPYNSQFQQSFNQQQQQQQQLQQQQLQQQQQRESSDQSSQLSSQQQEQQQQPQKLQMYQQKHPIHHRHHPTKGDLYDMKDLFKYFVNSVTFVSFLSEFRYHLVTNIVSPNVYDIVKQRIHFFYSNNDERPPLESCCQKIIRVMFTDTPPPYYFNYRPISTNERNFDEVIYYLRLSFGYADRHSLASSYRKIHHSKTRSNHNSIAPESCENSCTPIPLQSELSSSYANSTESEIHKTKSKSKYHSVKVLPNKPCT